jgi:putative tryptophan/tyrosine transport system substrate-binding protein
MLDLARRQFITLLGGAAAQPLAARAQQAAKVVQLGFFGPALTSPATIVPYEAFVTRLRELGFHEGQNIGIDYRNLDDPRGPFVAAAELMRLHPDLIVAFGPEVALQAVVGASRAIPIVIIAINYDPIERGYVTSLARPGGNITGVVSLQVQLAQKQVELLTHAFPDRTQLAILFDALSADQSLAAQRAAKLLNIHPHMLKVENPPYDMTAPFGSAAAEGAQMIVVLSSPLFIPHHRRIAELGIQHRLPTMFINRTYVEAGGLMSYGVNFPVMCRGAADYVAKIIKGAKPEDLPIEQAVKFELVVNLKTAKAIGLEVPPMLLAGADEVIE